jgi:hypothetical protein
MTMGRSKRTRVQPVDKRAQPQPTNDISQCTEHATINAEPTFSLAALFKLDHTEFSNNVLQLSSQKSTRSIYTKLADFMALPESGGKHSLVHGFGFGYRWVENKNLCNDNNTKDGNGRA